VAKPLVCGHRGACGLAPENTIAAFRKALELGADWVELDVQLTKDGHLVVVHDDTLERTTDKGGKRRPTEYTLQELKTFDAGTWFNKNFAGEKIPTLDEVLAEFGGKMHINIEIKSQPHFEQDNGIEVKVVEAVKRHDLIDGVLISSFDPSRLIVTHQIEPKLAIGTLFHPKSLAKLPTSDPFKLAELTHATALHPHFQMVTPEMVERAHKLGLQVNVWTVNEPGDIRRQTALGVDMIMSDFPDSIRKMTSDE
jgi:glycerophosphoryl diester phosphodiesterase